MALLLPGFPWFEVHGWLQVLVLIVLCDRDPYLTYPCIWIATTSATCQPGSTYGGKSMVRVVSSPGRRAPTKWPYCNFYRVSLYPRSRSMCATVLHSCSGVARGRTRLTMAKNLFTTPWPYTDALCRKIEPVERKNKGIFSYLLGLPVFPIFLPGKTFQRSKSFTFFI